MQMKKPCPLRGRVSFSSPSEPSENRTSTACNCRSVKQDKVLTN